MNRTRQNFCIESENNGPIMREWINNLLIADMRQWWNSCVTKQKLATTR